MRTKPKTLGNSARASKYTCVGRGQSFHQFFVSISLLNLSVSSLSRSERNGTTFPRPGHSSQRTSRDDTCHPLSCSLRVPTMALTVCRFGKCRPERRKLRILAASSYFSISRYEKGNANHSRLHISASTSELFIGF